MTTTGKPITRTEARNATVAQLLERLMQYTEAFAERQTQSARRSLHMLLIEISERCGHGLTGEEAEHIIEHF